MKTKYWILIIVFILLLNIILFSTVGLPESGFVESHKYGASNCWSCLS